MENRKKVLRYFEENKEFFETTVAANIEAYRKGNGVISVVDKDGKPVTSGRIRVAQTKHAFKFGANLFMLDELETEDKNQCYKNAFKKVFNMATLPFYWNSLEEQRGILRFDRNCTKFYRRPPIDLCMDFCEKNGIEPREHALAYEHTFPAWLKNATVDEVKAALELRYRQIAERYADRIPTIEVTNEMLWDHNVTPFYNENDYVEWCFKLADQYFPNNQLVVNDYTEAFWCGNCRSTDQYYAYIEANMLKGARIDAIGAQFHMFYTREGEVEKAHCLYNPRHLYNHMDLYATLAKGLQITEITIPAYSAEDEDEEIQAKLIEYLYTIWFSHPYVQQIIYWNLVDGYAYVSNPTPEKIRSTQGNMTVGENVYYGGLLRFDLSPKPAYRTLERLIHETWHTDVSGELDQGSFTFRGFYGEYEVEVEVNGTTKKASLNLSQGSNGHWTICI